MFRFVASTVVVLLAVTIALSEEFVGVITKFEDGKVTFKKFAKGGGGKGEEQTLAVAPNAKFMKAKFNKEEMKFETDGELEGGKAAFEKQVKEAAAKKPEEGKKGFGFGGVFAQIVTDGEGDKAKVTEIRVFPAFKGKKKDAE